MSGFIGILSPAIQATDLSLLDRAAAVIASCCTGNQDTWNGPRAAFRSGSFHTGSSPASAHLPVIIDNDLRILGDIRLDNRLRLVKELSHSSGTISSSTPDALLVLQAYKLYGEDCLQHISGDFAFAIYDGLRDELFCARDHFGVIPFYFAHTGNRFFFTNFYRALQVDRELMAELDDVVLDDFLLNGINRHFDKTVYIKVKKLPPAHRLKFRNGTLQISRYWEPPTEVAPIRYKKDITYADHFYQLFENAVADRISGNRLACSLSGGMDSSAIAATAKSVQDARFGNDHELVAYNIGYRHLVNENEGYFADLTARHLQVSIRHYIAEDYIHHITEPAAGWMPEPVAIPEATAESHILADAASFSGIFLTGFGGDPLFAYEPLSRQRLSRQGHRMQAVADDWMYCKTAGNLLPLALKAWQRVRGKRPSTGMAMPDWYDTASFAGSARPAAINPDGTSFGSNFSMARNPYWAWLFECSHPGFTGKPLQVRHPFFSLDLLQFALALPAHLLHRKALLRMAMIPRLPEAIVTRPKTPLYGNPYAKFLGSREVREVLEKRISEAGDFLRGKIDVRLLLASLIGPCQHPAAYASVIHILQIISWKKNTVEADLFHSPNKNSYGLQ
ncbi:asparagine synthetase B family protein [Chitinophaga rhizosphaerae]|uniref:asparagine synthetase B family protein n=1 Tax=Chitinophaga rhizosphaerae TaxID=1864947 RepID=UPI000F7FB67B|nr:asparagine synthase-related protein [Chitinophaga rhizosphaerae]